MDRRAVIETTLVPHTAFLNAKTRIEQCFFYGKSSPEPICIAIIGESRTGKSRLVEEVSEPWKKTRSKEGLYVPALRVKTPSKPTVKGLVTHMLKYMEDPNYDKGTEILKSIRLGTLMRNAGCQMIILDEFQHFYDRRRNTISEEVADWLKIFVEEAKVSLVVAGLPNCKAVIDQNEQLSGRFVEPIKMPRFSWADDQSRDEFIGILDAFSQSMSNYFSIPDLADEDMAFRVYCATGGLVGYVSKLLRQAVWDACDEERTNITLEALEEAHRKSLWKEWAIAGVSSPFSRVFALSPTSKVLATVAKIGTAPEPEARERGTKLKAAKMTSSAALGA